MPPSSFFPVCQAPTMRHLKISSTLTSSTKLHFRKCPAPDLSLSLSYHDSNQLALYVLCIVGFLFPYPGTRPRWMVQLLGTASRTDFPSITCSPHTADAHERPAALTFQQSPLSGSSLGLTVYEIRLSVNHLTSLPRCPITALSFGPSM